MTDRRSDSADVTFRERFRPPPARWLVAFLATMMVAATVLSIGDDLVSRLVYSSLPALFLLVFGPLTVVQVRDGRVYTSRRAGGRGLAIDDIVDRRSLTGPAVKEVRDRLTPSLRLHCPLWYRQGIQLITLDGAGEGIEHLYGVRDVGAFLDALDTPPRSVPHHTTRGVPI